MQDQEKIADKIRRLLALAESPNEHEAALAAAKAQELILIEALDKILGQLHDATIYGPNEMLVRVLEVKRLAREALAKVER